MRIISDLFSVQKEKERKKKRREPPVPIATRKKKDAAPRGGIFPIGNLRPIIPA
jgi:hypothetical protein